MALNTQQFMILPWSGGLNTSTDKGMIGPEELIQADNVIFDSQISKRPRSGVDYNWDDGTTTTNSIIALHDFWYESGTTKLNKRLSVSSSGSIYSYDTDGLRTDITPTSGSAWAAVTRATTLTIYNRVVIGAEDASRDLLLFDGTSSNAIRLQDDPLYDATEPAPPSGWLLQEHIGRLWTNDKSNPDRLHYSETGNIFKWNGYGDSGAIDIGVGDGDPSGITAIFPTFRGELIVAKKTKIYRISGYTPETFSVTLVADGVGCVGPQAVAAVDMEDIIWVSSRGIHSLRTTASFGDFEGKFLSAKIQPTFNDDIDRSRLKFAQARYLDQLNVIGFAFTIDGNSTNDILYLYNVEFGVWFRWTGQSCEALMVAEDSDQRRFYIGSSTERVGKTETAALNDTTTAGGSASITMTLKTGDIYPDKNPYTFKGFKKFGLVYRPANSHNIAVAFKTDIHDDQNLTFTAPDTLPLLDVSFVLGESVLDGVAPLAVYTKAVEGFGRGFSFTLVQDGTDEKIDVQGFVVEWEGASTKQAVNQGGDGEN